MYSDPNSEGTSCSQVPGCMTYTDVQVYEVDTGDTTLTLQVGMLDMNAIILTLKEYVPNR